MLLYDLTKVHSKNWIVYELTSHLKRIISSSFEFTRHRCSKNHQSYFYAMHIHLFHLYGISAYIITSSTLLEQFLGGCCDASAYVIFKAEKRRRKNFIVIRRYYFYHKINFTKKTVRWQCNIHDLNRIVWKGLYQMWKMHISVRCSVRCCGVHFARWVQTRLCLYDPS